MKKLFYVLVISAAFAACNNEAKSDAKTGDTTAVAPVTTAPASTDAAPATTAPASTDAAPATTAK